MGHRTNFEARILQSLSAARKHPQGAEINPIGALAPPAGELLQTGRYRLLQRH